MRSAEPRATNWYRVADGTTTGWQSGKPEGFKTGPYIGARDPFGADQASEPLWWPEGEKDVESVSDKGGLAFTFGGTGDGTPAGCEEYVRGRDVIILADNDPAGVEHAEKKAGLARPVAKSVRIIHFPDLPQKGDVNDFFQKGGTFADLQKIAAEAPIHEPPKDHSDEFGPAQATATPPQPLQWLDMSNWDNEPIPERKWAIRDRVPLNQVGLFSGEGGTGKSIIEMMKNVAHVTGKDWLGSLPEPGPALLSRRRGRRRTKSTSAWRRSPSTTASRSRN